MSRMFTLLVKDFAVNTEFVFGRAVPFDRAECVSFSEAMLKTFELGLVAKDIVLEQGDSLYNYRLTFRMFSGSSDITLTSTGVTTVFSNGQNKKVLRLIGGSVAAIETLLQKLPVQFRRLTFAAHADFRKPEEFDLHMGRVADKARGYSAGGIILHSSNNPFKGELRFTADKSFVYEKALFISCEVLTEDLLSNSLLNMIATRFDQVAKDIEIELNLNE